jgi:hypothetical protein
MAFSVGERVVSVADGQVATVLYVGEVNGTSGQWLGVEWDSAERGRHSGTHEGTEYFRTKLPNAGSFVRAPKMERGVHLLAAIKDKYGSCGADDVSEETLSGLKRNTGAALVEVVGFDDVGRKMADLRRLKVICLKAATVNGNLPEDNLAELLPNLRELDLSENLLSNWSQMITLGRHLPRLQVLNLSGNKMTFAEDSVGIEFARACPNMKQLTLGSMALDFAEATILTSALKSLEVLHLHSNRITEISIPPGCYLQVREMDLSQNPVCEWRHVMQLAHLPNLRDLYLNECQIKQIEVGSNLDSNCFVSLKSLQLCGNQIDRWECIANLGQIMRSLVDLKFRLNPILETDKGDNCRQIIVALIASLKVLNGTEIFKEERYGSELDYLKRYGKEYLDIAGTSQAHDEALTTFYKRHPRYPELMKRFGPPERGELTSNKPDGIKGNLIIVQIECPSVTGFEVVQKMLPRNMTVQKLKTLLQRIVKKKAHEMSISYRSQCNSVVEITLDNDMRELSFYSISSGDTILVK